MHDAFMPEEKHSDRADYSVKKEEGKLIFTIRAKDIPRLKSYFNTITGLVEVFERTGAL